MSVTIHDVAEKAGVSPSTVSRVFSGSDAISDETAERVMQVSERLGYKPRKYTRRKKAIVQNQVTVLSNANHNLTNNVFYSHIVAGVEETLSASGIHVIVRTFANDIEADMATVTDLCRTQGGLMLFGYDVDRKLIEYIRQQDVPFVLVDHDYSGAYIDTVVNDNTGGARRIVRHLIDLGHQRIGFVGGPAHHVSLHQRHTGFVQLMQEAALPVQPEWITFCEPSFRVDDGYRAMQQMGQDVATLPTAVVGANDALAIGIIRAASDMGLTVPDHLSVVGFDDAETSQYITPPLTTVRVLKREMGVEAAKRLLALAEGEATLPLKMILPVEVVLRASTAPPRHE